MNPVVSDTIRLARILCILLLVYAHAQPYQPGVPESLLSPMGLIHYTRQLLGHTSGLFDYFQNPAYAQADVDRGFVAAGIDGAGEIGPFDDRDGRRLNMRSNARRTGQSDALGCGDVPLQLSGNGHGSRDDPGVDLGGRADGEVLVRDRDRLAGLG